MLASSVYQYSSRFILIFQFTIAAIVLAFALFANAHVVVDIAKPHSHVGSHGPALVNTHGKKYCFSKKEYQHIILCVRSCVCA